MTGKLFLSGGGSGKQTFDLDEIFLQGVNKILYIPVAWGNGNYEECIEWFENAMFLHRPVEFDMFTDLSDNVDLDKYDAVYVGGGNTFKLLKAMRDSGFDKKLIEHYASGGTVYGGSAGAIIWGYDISTAGVGEGSDVNEVGLQDTKGFDILNGIDIQCHYEDSQLQEHQQYAGKTGRDIMAIPEESALLIDDNVMKVIGTEPISIITRTSVERFDVGQEVSRKV